MIRQTGLDEYQWSAWMQKPNRITHMLDVGCVICTFCDWNYFSAFQTFQPFRVPVEQLKLTWNVNGIRALGFGIIPNKFADEILCPFWWSLPLTKVLFDITFLHVVAADKVNGEHWSCLQEIDALDDCMCKVHRKTTLRLFVFKYFCRQQN